ncbi:MAG: hypothetical protein EBZ48_05780 [Proteobacteria bacterium]|nr:hypothetical protein [Pseudomonadota bacterium]
MHTEQHFGGGGRRSDNSLRTANQPSTVGEYFYDVEYRKEVATAMLAKAGASQSILFDDVFNALHESQREFMHGAAGYMRCAIPAAELAAIAPAHVVLLTPPLPEEIAFAESYVESLGGKRSNLQFWLFDGRTRELTNLSHMIRDQGVERYRDLIDEIAANPPGAEYADHFLPAHKLIERIGESGKVLVLPFQTKHDHHVAFKNQIEAGAVALPDASDVFIDKFSAAEALVRADQGMRKYLLNPQRVSGSAQVPGKSFEEQALQHATSIIEAAIRTEERAGSSYIKLDGAGVSGLDNLSPAKYPQMYEGSREQRIAVLSGYIQARFGATEKFPSAVIEDRVGRVTDAFGVCEYVVSGVTTGNGFRPWCVVRAINDKHDVFQGVIGSTDPSKIGVTASHLSSLLDVMDVTGRAMQRAGYDFGYISKDLMLDLPSNSMKINDHNDRRGGRSFMERVLPLYPGKVLMDKDYEFEVPQGQTSASYATELNRRAIERGHLAYGTCTCFYPTKEQDRTMVKMKIVSVVPDDILEGGADIVQRSSERLRQSLLGT